MLVVFEAMSTRGGAVVNDDVLYQFRLRLFSLAAELGNVREACRIFGVHPSTYYRWRGPVLRSGLEPLVESCHGFERIGLARWLVATPPENARKADGDPGLVPCRACDALEPEI